MKVVVLDHHRAFEGEADELEVAIAYLHECKEKAARATKDAAQAEVEVLRLLEERGQKSATSHYNGGWQATAVYGERLKINEDALKKAVGAPMWTAISVRKLDKGKLEEAIGSDKIDPHVVATCSTIEPNKPYVRVTEHKTTDEADGD